MICNFNNIVNSIKNNNIFYPIQKELVYFSQFERWPTLMDYNEWWERKEKERPYRDKNIKFIKQIVNINDFFDMYEPRVYLKGEVQTREKQLA